MDSHSLLAVLADYVIFFPLHLFLKGFCLALCVITIGKFIRNDSDDYMLSFCHHNGVLKMYGEDTLGQVKNTLSARNANSHIT